MIEEELKCDICLDIVRDPVETGCCHQIRCGTCVAEMDICTTCVVDLTYNHCHSANHQQDVNKVHTQRL